MKILFSITLLFSFHAFATQNSCQNYSVSCACFPNIPFEGFKLHIVEKCDSKEEWSTTYDAPTFETEAECLVGAKTDPVCKELE